MGAQTDKPRLTERGDGVGVGAGAGIGLGLLNRPQSKGKALSLLQGGGGGGGGGGADPTSRPTTSTSRPPSQPDATSHPASHPASRPASVTSMRSNSTARSTLMVENENGDFGDRTGDESESIVKFESDHVTKNKKMKGEKEEAAEEDAGIQGYGSVECSELSWPFNDNYKQHVNVKILTNVEVQLTSYS